MVPRYLKPNVLGNPDWPCVSVLCGLVAGGGGRAAAVDCGAGHCGAAASVVEGVPGRRRRDLLLQLRFGRELVGPPLGRALQEHGGGGARQAAAGRGASERASEPVRGWVMGSGDAQ